MRPEVQLIIFGATSSAVSIPAAPTLALLTGPANNTPGFALTGDLAINDVIRFQYSTSAVFAGASEITNTINAGQDAANELDFSTGALADGTWYFRARIERGAFNSGWSNTQTETIDATAPTLSSPVGTKTGITTADLSSTTNEGNGTHYAVVVLASDSAPSATQITQGKNNAGSAAVYSSNQVVSSTGAKTYSATGLTGATAYKAYFAQIDAAGNMSASSVTLTFTTDSASSTVTLDTKTGMASQSASGTSSSYSLHTITGGLTNSALIVTVTQTNISTVNLTGMTLNWDSGGTPQPMTQVSTKATANGQVWIFGLRNPTAGNKTLSLSWTNTGQVLVGSISLSGVNVSVDDATAFAHASNNSGSSSTTPTVTTTSQTNDLVINVWASTNNFNGSYSGTEIYHSNNGTTYTGAASYDTGAASVAATTTTASGNYLAAGIDVVHA